MSSLGDVITALATRIKTGMGSDVLSGRTFDYAVDSVNTPCAIVLPDPGGDFVSFDTTMDGADDFALIVKVLISSAISRTGQDQLLGYMDRSGATSIRTAIYGDKTLGGVVADLMVVGARNYGDVEYAGIQYFGAELMVTVYT